MSRFLSTATRWMPVVRQVTWLARCAATPAISSRTPRAFSVCGSKEDRYSKVNRYTTLKGTLRIDVRTPHGQAELTPEGRLLQQNLARGQADPVITLKAQIQAGSANLETAKLCLDACFEQLRKLPRRQRRQQMRNTLLGTLTLQWLWSSDDLWASAVTYDPNFKDKLCLFATANDQDDFLNHWRGSLLRGLVSAHLTHDTKGSADDALQLFFRVLKSVQKARRENQKLPLASCLSSPAEVELSRMLPTGWFPNTSPKLFDDFLVQAARSRAREPFRMAKLQMSHPTRSDPMPMLSYLRENLGPMTPSSFATDFPNATNHRETIYFFMYRTEALLRSRGEARDADYINDLMHSLVHQREFETLAARVQKQFTSIENRFRKRNAKI
ncbi:hypothetical protein LTR27_001653 [Elasticomyces elasticus]|nr:hypothetical protein LTR27_001653 [Elasticomyces elasticus]